MLLSKGKEVEIKLPLKSAEEGRARLEQAGFSAEGKRQFEANSVLDQPDGSLRMEKCLLRMREFAGDSILTYKGPPEEGVHKVREEIETHIQDSAAFGKILHRLGYLVTFRYEKWRTIYRKPGQEGLAVLDETPIGVYLELEGAPEWIDATAEDLGFGKEQYILDSYGSLYLQYCQRKGVSPGNMVFERG
jgi:adenylate cyclase class 2